MLAVSWIAIVHMFNAHLAGIFPFNPAIFTGKLRKDRYEHEHPLEYARLTAVSKPKAPARVVAVQGDGTTQESEGV
jgi:hypothetical protein